MNPFGQLLWREWRRSRTILTIALATLVAMVFLSILFIAIVEPESLAGPVLAAAKLVAIIYCVVLPIIAAVMLGAGRDEGSAESVAPLPVSHLVGLAAKLVFLSAVSFATSALVLWITCAREFSRPTGIAGLPSLLELPTTIGLIAILATYIVRKSREWIAIAPIAAALAMVLPPAALWFIAPAPWFFETTGRQTGIGVSFLSAWDLASWLGFSAASYAFAIGTVLLPFLAATTLAGERADRSAEFLAPLPVSRVLRLAARVTFLGAVWLATSGPLLSICSYVRWGSPPWAYRDEVWVLAFIGSFTLLATATAWLIAAWIESPVIAGMTAIAVPIVIPWACFVLPEIVGIPPFFKPNAFIGLWFTSGGMPQPFTFLVALALFGAGSALYLRRLE